MNHRSPCIIREIPFPEREYRVAPPENWEKRPKRRPSGAKRRRRRMADRLVPALLALCLAFGFLLGRASAAKKQAGTPSVVRSRPGQEAVSPDPVSPESTSRKEEIPVSALTVGPQSSAGSAASAPAASTPAASAPMASDLAAEPGSQDGDWKLTLINKDHALDRDYQAPELTGLANGHAVDSRIYPALQRMMDAARAAGVQPTICSSFRTWETQERLYQNKISRLKNEGWDPETAEQEAARWVARPGTSEHQAGLAVDIVDKSYQMLDHQQETTAAQRWLMAHCAEYGFILRYPSDKGELTGVGYEPWHYRYVGEEAAQSIMSQGICLEEYIEGLEKTAS